MLSVLRNTLRVLSSAPTYGHPAVLPTEGLARNTTPFDTTTNYHFHLEHENLESKVWYGNVGKASLIGGES